MSEEQAALYQASVARMRSQIQGKAATAAQDRSQKGAQEGLQGGWLGGWQGGWLGGWQEGWLGAGLDRPGVHPAACAPNWRQPSTAPLGLAQAWSASCARWAPRRSATCSRTCARSRSTRCSCAPTTATSRWPSSRAWRTSGELGCCVVCVWRGGRDGWQGCGKVGFGASRGRSERSTEAPARPSPAPCQPSRQMFGPTATERRVREELLGYSDFSLHAFCYNGGPEFAGYK